MMPTLKVSKGAMVQAYLVGTVWGREIRCTGAICSATSAAVSMLCTSHPLYLVEAFIDMSVSNWLPIH
jgi:hypothetical protein